MFNIIFDFFLGLVPFVGDIADAAFRCNTRNAVLLEAHLREKGKRNLEKKGLPVPPVDPSDSEAFDRREAQGADNGDIVDGQPRGETMEMRQENRRHNGQTNGHTSADQGSPARGPMAPPRAATRDNTRSGWFGSGGRQRTNDIEMGRPDVGRRY